MATLSNEFLMSPDLRDTIRHFLRNGNLKETATLYHITVGTLKDWLRQAIRLYMMEYVSSNGTILGADPKIDGDNIISTPIGINWVIKNHKALYRTLFSNEEGQLPLPFQNDPEPETPRDIGVDVPVVESDPITSPSTHVLSLINRIEDFCSANNLTFIWTISRKP